MSVTVTLTCNQCGASEETPTFLKLTRSGVLRLEGVTQYMVDGGGARCPRHWYVPIPTPQRETWADADRRHADALDLLGPSSGEGGL